MRPGEQIEHYVLIEQIGQGGQAAVWSAEDQQLKRMVAIKTINLTAPVDPSASAVATPEAPPATVEELTERFRGEAQTIAELEHPFILPIYSYGQKAEWLYIVMRYMAGGTLKKFLDQRALSLDELIKIAGPVADALNLAHERNIIHRDIKSVNILMDAQHRPYLADFGLSVTIGDSRAASGSGTLAYMSPEQMGGQPSDHRSDIYSFGILLYEMLTGHMPTVNGKLWNIEQVIGAAPLPVPADMSPEVATVLQRATALRPEDRYDHAPDIVDDLREVANQTQKQVEIIGGDLLLPINDPAMQASIEANQLFQTALEKWADGAGRFRLYEEDFQYVDSFYSAGETLGIQLDEAATRLMLRSALEFGYHLDLWWNRVEQIADRRAVTLQALSSELPAARLRALERLTAIQDSVPPAIPTRVANLIAKEPEAEVRLIGIKLLELRGGQPEGWRESAFDTDVDSVLRNLATTDPDGRISEAAARACGRLRAAGAVRGIADAAETGNNRAFQALVAVRDEAPSLPSGVSSGLRQRVFSALTVRQLLSRSYVPRYLSALLGFGLPWAIINIVQFNAATGGGQLLIAQAIGNALAGGVLYGALVAVALVVAIEPALRLRAWTPASRVALSAILGGLLTVIVFVVIRAFYYFSPDPPVWQWLLPCSLIFTLGFAISNGLYWKTPLRASVSAVGVFVAVYGSYLLYQAGTTAFPVLLFLNDDVALSLSLVVAFFTGVLSYLPELTNGIGRAARGMGHTSGRMTR
ncbi:MAG TPA: serine/threonine-protein kinase [Aggregatilineales bacterium]|nr:serine/threonine-protein kinase [Aggregatilineales bacterium]